MEPDYCINRQIPQYFIKSHIFAAARFSVEKSAAWDFHAKHFFEAKRLRAELDFVAPVFLWLAALVFYWKRIPSAILIFMELDDIRLSRQAKIQRFHQKPVFDLHICALASSPLIIGFFMEKLAFEREPVLLPDLLDMDQRALSFAENKVLQCGKLDETVFSVLHVLSVFFF
jgi:hypothetical protein